MFSISVLHMSTKMTKSTIICCFILLFIHADCLSKDENSIEFPLRVGAFNIQNLGNNKFRNKEVMHTVKNILLRYDFILVQELVIQDQGRIKDLILSLNRLSPAEYDLALSERLGRGRAKEQYAFIYRKERISILDETVYPDEYDDFMRPPFIVHVSSPTTNGISEFVAIGIHTQPSNAANETDALVDVYEYARKKYKTKDAIIMGDMNAGCATVRKSDWNNIRLWTNSSFHWLIGHEVDTTTNLNSCPYDRIVIAGNNMKNAIIPNSANTFNFRDAYQLTNEQTRNVSDHWPVEVMLRGKVSDEVQDNLIASICFSIVDKRDVADPMIVHRARKKFDFQTTASKDDNGNYYEVVARRKSENLNELLHAFKKLAERFPKVISNEVLQTIDYKSRYGALNDESSFTATSIYLYSLEMTCNVNELKCSWLICQQTTIN